MKLLTSPTSPYARKARILVIEKQLPCEVVVANPWENSPDVLAHNPLRKIPILVLDNGEAIVDSRVICEYLDAQNETPRFLPSDAAARTKTKTREAVAEGALDAVLAVIMAGRVAPNEMPAAWKDWLMGKAAATLTYFESEMPQRDAGAPDMADVVLGCLLGTLSFRMPDYDWRGAQPQTAVWYDALMTRESFQQTIPAA